MKSSMDQESIPKRDGVGKWEERQTKQVTAKCAMVREEKSKRNQSIVANAFPFAFLRVLRGKKRYLFSKKTL